jgi:hypothetical protein
VQAGRGVKAQTAQTAHGSKRGVADHALSMPKSAPRALKVHRRKVTASLPFPKRSAPSPSALTPGTEPDDDADQARSAAGHRLAVDVPRGVGHRRAPLPLAPALAQGDPSPTRGTSRRHGCHRLDPRWRSLHELDLGALRAVVSRRGDPQGGGLVIDARIRNVSALESRDAQAIALVLAAVRGLSVGCNTRTPLSAPGREDKQCPTDLAAPSTRPNRETRSWGIVARARAGFGGQS